jgi:hypothetical protein
VFEDNIGGGLWEVEVSATITDAEGNPVADGTAVFFSLPDEPEFASIVAYAFVGNENADGDSIPGVAYTKLTYEGQYSNEEIAVSASVGTGENNVSFSVDDLVLPMNGIEATILPTPSHIDFNGTVAIGVDISVIKIDVEDEQGNKMRDCIGYLSSDKGEFLQPDGNYLVDPNDNTVVITDDDGHTEGKIKAEWHLCPPSNPPPGQETITLFYTVPNTDIQMQQITIYLWNYAGLL